MARHRAQHRLQRQPILRPDLGNPVWHLWWILPLAATVCIVLLTVTVTFTPPETGAERAVAASTLPRPDPTTTEEARAFLDALAAHRVAVEPHQAVFAGQAVCAQRRQFNTSLATLAASVRQYMPNIRKIDAATLVDDADRNLCR
jgi:hypothetical protein